MRYQACSRRLAFACAAGLAGLSCTTDGSGTGGGPPTVVRDTTDQSPPVLTLTITASTRVAGGIEELPPGSRVTLKDPGGSVIVQASDSGGVGWVEFWMNEGKACDGTSTGPGISGKPTKRVEGDLSSTAPGALSAGIDINLMKLDPDCLYTFEVWGEAANAASSPATTQIAFSTLLYQPTS